MLGNLVLVSYSRVILRVPYNAAFDGDHIVLKPRHRTVKFQYCLHHKLQVKEVFHRCACLESPEGSNFGTRSLLE